MCSHTPGKIAGCNNKTLMKCSEDAHHPTTGPLFQKIVSPFWRKKTNKRNAFVLCKTSQVRTTKEQSGFFLNGAKQQKGKHPADLAVANGKLSTFQMNTGFYISLGRANRFSRRNSTTAILFPVLQSVSKINCICRLISRFSPLWSSVWAMVEVASETKEVPFLLVHIFTQQKSQRNFST